MEAISNRNLQEAPPAWRVVLVGVKLGRAAIAGAGLALALLGIVALIDAAAATAMVTVPVIAIGTEALNIAATVGALVGAGFQALFNR